MMLPRGLPLAPRPRLRTFVRLALGIALGLGASTTTFAQLVSISSDDGLKRWQLLSLDLEGPHAAELDDLNPFLARRMEVFFTHFASGEGERVPGYFAADGDAANTSASKGKIWRAHLTPQRSGEWRYRVSFRTGPRVAIRRDAGQPLAPFDGLTGSFVVDETEPGGKGPPRRERGRWRLANGMPFVSRPAPRSTRLLACSEIDGTPAPRSPREDDVSPAEWERYLESWRDGSPLWKDRKGRALTGALHAISGSGRNEMPLTLVDVDPAFEPVIFPFVAADERTRFDVSKLAQWQIFLAHAGRLGIVVRGTLPARTRGQSDESLLLRRELEARFGQNLSWAIATEPRPPDVDRGPDGSARGPDEKGVSPFSPANG